MSVSSTRKVSLSSPSRVAPSGGRSQSVEDIDTRNNVLVRDEGQDDSSSRERFASRQQGEFSDFKSNMTSGLDALALSGMLEENYEEKSAVDNKNVNVYSSNQSIVKDEDVERIGRRYLKQFYEKNEPITDVNELV